MIKPIAAAVVCVAAMIAPAQAQTFEDAFAAQYGVFKKFNVAAKLCVSELDRMQVERNDHYEALLHTRARDPDAPTIAEMWDVLVKTHPEDAALNQKRHVCSLLLDQLVAAAKELRRDCEAYTNTHDEPATAAELATKICHGSAKPDG